MDFNFTKRWLTASAAVVLCLLIVGCTDNKYDFDQVDMTIGVGAGDLQIPASSTDIIMLDDVLELNDSKSVIIAENGDYLFKEVGEDVDAAEPFVDKITLVKRMLISNPLTVSLPASHYGMGANAMTVGIETESIVHEFEYSDDCPEEVIMISEAGVESHLSLKLSFSKSLKKVVPVIKELTLELPEFLELKNIESNEKIQFVNGKLVFTDVPTSMPLMLNEDLSKLNFEAKNKTLGSVDITNGSVKAFGQVKLGIKADVNLLDILGVDLSDLKIDSELDISDIKLTKVIGRASPKINLDNLGDVEVTGIPDFLTGGNVVVDLCNPQVLLNIDNTMDIAANIKGALVAKKDEKELYVIDIPEFYISANGKTRLCFCRTTDGVDKDKFDQVVVIPNLSELIKEVPDYISLSGEANADSERISSFELGKHYSIKPSYEVVAPLAFAEDARIEYKDTITDWNKELQDIELSQGAYVKVEANIESCIPAYLYASAAAIGIDGKDLNGVEVSVSNGINASSDGVTAVKTPVIIMLKQTVAGALKKLDGVRLSIEGSAKSAEGQPTIVGQTLNAYRHSLKASNIKITLSGQVIVDMN